MTMNRRMLRQRIDDLQYELSQAIARAEAAEQELRDLRAVQHLLVQRAAPSMAFPRETPRDEIVPPIAGRFPEVS